MQAYSWFAVGGALAAILMAAPSSTFAQASSANAVASAIDAFGERVGAEQIGLYDENQVRGFNLSKTGGYRIDGVYFARIGAMADALVDGVGVRVGVNASRLDYPAASGLVAYRLKRAEADDRSLAGSVGFRQNFSPFVELDGRWGSASGTLGLAGGAIMEPHVTFPDRSWGEIYSLGLAPEWRPVERVSLRAILAWDHLAYTHGGDYGHYSDFAGLPRNLTLGKRNFPDWTSSRYDSYLAGVIAEAGLPSGWKLRGGLFTGLADEASDFAELDIRPDFTARATLFHMPQRVARAVSGEARVSRDVKAGGAEHEISVAVRFRQMGSSTAEATTIDLGVVDLAGNRDFGPPRPRPDLPGRSIDQVRQETISFGYVGDFADRLQIRGGLHEGRYAKSDTPDQGSPSRISRDVRLWHASAIYRLDETWAVFGSSVRSLEDSGVAPANARNRGETLAPVQARQDEFGLRWSITPQLAVIGAAFDVEKPVPGLDRDGTYNLIGDVRHRGVEVSMSGRLDSQTQIVAGLAAMQPRIRGPLVESGQVGARPVGVSEVTAVLGIDHQLTAAPAWSIDAQLNYSGSRPGDSLNTFRTPRVALLNLGARYRFKLQGRDAVLRLNATNVLANASWRAVPSGSLNQVDAPTLRIELTAPLVH